MSRLRQALQKYKTTNNNDFFFLANDKDSAPVRFLYNENEDELDYYVVHEAEIGGKKRWVQCPETTDCPFCKAGKNPQLKIFLQLIDYRDNKVKTWERGQTFIGKILSNIERYGALHKRKFEVERNGEKGSTQTTYELFALDPDNLTLEQLAEQGFKKQVLLGENAFILQKSIEDMQKILDGSYQFERVEGVREEPTRREAPAQSQTPLQAPPAQNQTPPSQRRQPPAQEGSNIF